MFVEGDIENDGIFVFVNVLGEKFYISFEKINGFIDIDSIPRREILYVIIKKTESFAIQTESTLIKKEQ